MMLASFVGPVGAIGCTVGTQIILNRISGYLLGWPGGEVKVTKKKIKPFSSLSWP